MLNLHLSHRVRPFVRAALPVLMAAGVVAAPAIASSVGGPDATAKQAAGDHPPIFSHVSYADAMNANKSDGKILVVKATAAWCGPCKMMDKTTWRDADVVKFMNEKGVAIALDVDEHPQDAQTLRIRAMPTMIAFRNGKELDRIVGYKSAQELLAWLNGVEKGETGASRLETRLKQPREGDGAMSMQERMEFAGDLVDAGRLDDATEEYVWLWNNMVRVQPSMTGVRGSFLVGSISALVAQHAPAMKRFAEIRDEVEARLRGENKSWNDLSDWLCLNEATQDADRTLAWFDRIKNDEDAGATLERFAFRIEPLLKQNGRWADYGRVIKNPVERVKRSHTQAKFMAGMKPPGLDENTARQLVEHAWQNFRDESGGVYSAMLASGRSEEAARVAQEALRLDDTPETRIALVKAALSARQASAAVKSLLDPVQGHEDEVGALREELAQQMGPGVN